MARRTSPPWRGALAESSIPLPYIFQRCGDDAFAVGAEGRARHPVLMASQGLADGLASIGVPQPRRSVVGHGDDAPVIGTERRAYQQALMAENPPLAQRPPSCIKRKLGFGNIGPIRSGVDAAPPTFLSEQS